MWKSKRAPRRICVVVRLRYVHVSIYYNESSHHFRTFSNAFRGLVLPQKRTGKTDTCTLWSSNLQDCLFPKASIPISNSVVWKYRWQISHALFTTAMASAKSNVEKTGLPSSFTVLESFRISATKSSPCSCLFRYGKLTLYLVIKTPQRRKVEVTRWKLFYNVTDKPSNTLKRSEKNDWCNGSYRNCREKLG